MHTSTVMGTFTAALVMALGAQAAPVEGQHDAASSHEVIKRVPQGFITGLADLFKMSDLMGAGVDTDGGDQGTVTQNSNGGVTVGVGSVDIKRSPQGFLEGLEDLFKISDGVAAGVDTDGDDSGSITQNSDGTATVNIGDTDI